MKRLTVAVLLCSLRLASQTSTPAGTKDATGVTVLNQCIVASGGSVAISSIQDLTATGTITYNWGKSPVQGTATVRSRGSDQIRLDSSILAGTKAWTVVSADNAEAKDTDGTTKTIPIEDAVTLSGLPLPTISLNTALTDPNSSIRNVTPQDSSDFVIRVIRSVPLGESSLPDSRDYTIDGTTFLVTKVQSKTHPIETTTTDYSREIGYAGYQTVNGVLVPFSITEKIVGQQTYSISLNSVAFNSGLTSTDFTF